MLVLGVHRGTHSHQVSEPRGKRTGTGRAHEPIKEPGEVALSHSWETQGLPVQLAERDSCPDGTSSEISR